MLKIVRMEVGGLYSLDRSGQLRFENDEALKDRIEKYLENILNESQRVLLVMKKLKSLSVDKKL